MKILCSNIIMGNVHCGRLQNPLKDGWVCLQCHKKIKIDGMIVYNEKGQRAFIGFSDEERKGQIEIGFYDSWSNAEEKIKYSNIWLATWEECEKAGII